MSNSFSYSSSMIYPTIPHYQVNNLRVEKMKRENQTTATTPPPATALSIKSESPYIKPSPRSTPSPKRKAATSTPAATAGTASDTSEEDVKSTKKSRKAGSSSGAAAMTPDIKEAMVEHIFRLGHAAMQKDDLATEVRTSLHTSNVPHMLGE